MANSLNNLLNLNNILQLVIVSGFIFFSALIWNMSIGFEVMRVSFIGIQSSIDNMYTIETATKDWKIQHLINRNFEETLDNHDRIIYKIAVKDKVDNINDI